MVHYFPGNIGHILVITSFITSVFAALGYFFASKYQEGQNPWIKFSNLFFYSHSLAIVGIVVTLYFIISNNFFEYHYAWSHSSKILPTYYQISSFWEGQEGSFLLWTFWNVLLGLVIIRTNRFWTAPVMTIFSLVQAFLTSMILGVVVIGDFKLGSSPFILLRQVLDAPIFKVNPDFVPKDGNGLNPLLQNYWMVIHPPTLFLGFASTIVPFAFCMAGLWKGKFKEWIRPALPWAQFSALVLGIGILMGAYWAYETLNFGGYWNWDPVENAIYVPWLVLVAGIHTMIAFKKSNKALKSSILLITATFLLIVYSTFLTRSGILGDSSVHSFTDLGLSGQLLVYLFGFIFLSAALIQRAWKKIPSNNEEISTFSREFWIFMGATTLCLMAFHVIFVTSFPVYNSIADIFGFDLNLAPPVDQVNSYSEVQIWFAILLAFLSGTGQFFWWKRVSKKEVKNALFLPVIISLLITSVIIIVAKIRDPKYILLLVGAVYSLVANIKILLSVVKTSPTLTGGSITHAGVALMLLGILFSSGYSKIISTNYTGMVWHRDFPEEVNRDNLLLFINEPRQMSGYTLNYRGIRRRFKSKGYINEHFVTPTSDPLKYLSKRDLPSKGIKQGDTLAVIGPENRYFEIEYLTDDKSSFTMYPRVQMNETMDMIVYSPDIRRTVSADLYTHVRTFPNPEDKENWSELKQMKVPVGGNFFLNDYVAVFEGVERVQKMDAVVLGEGDVAVKARIKISGEAGDYYAEPLYIIKDKMAGKIPAVVPDLAIKIEIESINPEDSSFTFGVSTAQKDWVILEAIEKPFINLLWLGTLLLSMGFAVAIRRRYVEFQKMRNKGME